MDVVEQALVRGGAGNAPEHDGVERQMVARTHGYLSVLHVARGGEECFDVGCA